MEQCAHSRLHRCVRFHDTLYAVYGLTAPVGGDVDDGGGDGGGVEGVGLAGRDMPLPLGGWGAPAGSVVVSVALASCRERRTCAPSAVRFPRSPPRSGEHTSELQS